MDLFEGIDLNDSAVLNWAHKSARLSFELDFSIWPGSKYYTEIRSGEYTCYRRGTLVFDEVHKVEGLKEVGETAFTEDPDGAIDYGNIDGLVVRVDGYDIYGDFGAVTVQGGRLELFIST